jgi:transcriptional regulator with XRE-family HTH domain
MHNSSSKETPTTDLSAAAAAAGDALEACVKGGEVATVMEQPHFGATLRRSREQKSLALTEIARRTKIPVSSLQLLEAGKLDQLPPEVFVRGFIRSYARALGVTEAEPLQMFDHAIAARRQAAHAVATEPKAPASPLSIDPIGDDESGGRRGIGIAVFVIIVLLIATITLSLFLRQPPQSGEGLSLRDVPASDDAALVDNRLPPVC